MGCLHATDCDVGIMIGFLLASPKRRTYARTFCHLQIDDLLSLRALPITETELKLIAAAASIGLNRIPKNGYNIPASRSTANSMRLVKPNLIEYGPPMVSC